MRKHSGRKPTVFTMASNFSKAMTKSRVAHADLGKGKALKKHLDQKPIGTMLSDFFKMITKSWI